MAEHLNTRQRNNLLVGNGLAAEMAGTGLGKRAFIIVWPYHEQSQPQETVRPLAACVERRTFSKVLNADCQNEGNVRYGCAVIEVEEAALAAYLEVRSVSDSARRERRTLATRRNLNGLEEAEAELRCHLDDLEPLDVEWRVLPWMCG